MKIHGERCTLQLTEEWKTSLYNYLHRWNAFSGVRIEACNKTFQPWSVAKVSGVILETIASIMTLLVAVFWQVDYVYTDQTRAYGCKQDFEIDLHFHGGI